MVNASRCLSQVSLAKTVTIHEIPDLPFMTNNGPVCEGEPVRLTAGAVPGVQYNWYREIILTDTTTAFELVANSQSFEVFDLPTGTHRYYLVLERNGCSVSSLPDNTTENSTGIFTEVVIRTVPAVSLPAISGTFCEGDSLRLDAPSIPSNNFRKF